jgi:glycosyltransferase involved in cell wall biosynthesis
VIPNGVDAREIHAANPLPADGAMILTVDRLSRWTGISRIISALPALSPSYRLVVVGSGWRRNALEAHAEYLGVADRVHFAGAVDDAGLYRLLRTASVLVTLKEESLWGGMLLEAICAETPVVASDLPANREAALLAGAEGIAFVSRRASPFVVADAIFEQAQSERRLHPDRVPTWDEMTEQTFEAYRELLEDTTLRRVA